MNTKQSAISSQLSALDELIDGYEMTFNGETSKELVVEARAELTRLRTRNEQLRERLWITTTRYHDMQKHEGVMDACEVLTCASAARLLADEQPADAGEVGEKMKDEG